MDGIPSPRPSPQRGEGERFRAGRSCPLSYRYSPAVFNRDPEIVTDTLYVIGGLYGNVPALDALLELAATEKTPPTLVFNGDFNWFNIAPATFTRINEAVLSHTALRGNVETELASDDDMGCGCGYPDEVSDEEVERSNEIASLLRTTAKRHASIRNALGALPMHAVAQVGDVRVGVVHGDAESLAGWGFAHEQLSSLNQREALMRIFAIAGVDVFASSHTCLPALRRLAFGTVINNGAAGMPNFRDTQFGLISRIATSPTPIKPLYGARCREVHIDALPLNYNAARWETEFLSQWRPGSPAHVSYLHRIRQGPRFTPQQATS